LLCIPSPLWGEGLARGLENPRSTLLRGERTLKSVRKTAGLGICDRGLYGPEGITATEGNRAKRAMPLANPRPTKGEKSSRPTLSKPYGDKRCR